MDLGGGLPAVPYQEMLKRLGDGAVTERVESTSDERTVNNTMRHQYRVLSEFEKAQMAQLKDMGAAFIGYLRAMGGKPGSERLYTTREYALAATKMEEAVMWAVKGLTG